MTNDEEILLTFSKDDGVRNIYTWALFFVSAVLMFHNIWSGSLLPWDEGTYGEIAREIIVEKEGWLTLHLNYQPWFEKPPLYIWLIALAYKVFGVNEFSVRIWSALFGFGCVILLSFFSKKLFLSRRIAFFSSLSLIGFTQFVKHSKMGLMDAPLTFFILLGLFFFWIGRKKDCYLLLVGITTGTAFLIKSFAALSLPIIIIVFAFADGEAKKLVKNKKLFLGFLIGFLICSPWHIYEYIQWGSTFPREYFTHHILGRSFEALFSKNRGALYYFTMLLSQNIPLGAISYLTIPYIFYSLHSEKDRERRAAFILVIAPVAVTLFLFSLVKTKVITYIMLVYPFLSMSIAVTAERIINIGRSDNRKLLIMTTLVIILLTIPVGRFILDKTKTLDYHPRLKNLSLSAKSNSNKQEVLFLYLIPEIEEVLFYSERKITQVDRDELLRKASDSKSFLCLMSKIDGFFEDLKKYGLTILYENDDYILYQIGFLSTPPKNT